MLRERATNYATCPCVLDGRERSKRSSQEKKGSRPQVIIHIIHSQGNESIQTWRIGGQAYTLHAKGLARFTIYNNPFKNSERRDLKYIFTHLR